MEPGPDFLSLEPRGLCAVCRRVIAKIATSSDPQKPLNKRWLPHHRTLDSYVAALKQGCYLCTRAYEHPYIGDTIFDLSQAPPHGLKGLMYRAFELLVKGSFTRYARISPQHDHLIYGAIRARSMSPVEFMGFLAYPSESGPSADQLSASTSSHLNHTTLRSWFHTCIKDHSRCAANYNPSWMPTRILDLGAHPAETWNLTIPEHDNIPIPKYTTISYCWGDGDFIKLTSGTFASFRSGLPVSCLPQTFQDCISITRDLGIRFIWIDALCILQDDNDDLYRECALMSNIYTNSSCNIIASFAENPNAPLFRARNIEALRFGKLERDWRANKPALEIVANLFQLSEEVERCVIHSRGWIFQELLLASRALYIGTNEFQWICRDLKACERWPMGNPPGIDVSLDSGLSGLDLSETHGQHQFIWLIIVQRYSKLNLSHEEDKLLALSGIAKLFQQRGEDEYLCGHWKSTLPSTLSWRTEREETGRTERAREGERCPIKRPPRRNSVYTAPTWSWASMHGSVDFPMRSSHSTLTNVLCTILDVYIKTAGDDPTGRVVEGHLILRAPRVYATVSDIRTLTVGKVEFHGDWYVSWDDWDADLPALGTQVSLAITEVLFGAPGSLIVIYALILIPLEDHNDTYRRIGTVSPSLLQEHERENPFVKSRTWSLELLDKFGLIANRETRDVKVVDESMIHTFKVV